MSLKIRILGLFLLVLAAPPALAQRVRGEGLITQKIGAVSYTVGVPGTKALSARAFQTARQGDTYTLAAGSRLRVIYYRSGVQESWTGPARFKVGAEHSERLQGAAPKLRTMGGAGISGLRTVPDFLKRAGRTRLGAGRVRAGQAQVRWADPSTLPTEAKSAVANAKAGYVAALKVAAKDDPTPDLAYAGVLWQHRLKADLAAHLQSAVKRHPKDETLRAMQQGLLVGFQPLPTP